MGSGDLNLLKSWNPKLMKNRKKVWETEQDLVNEQQKLNTRLKEIEKERELNELLKESDKSQTNSVKNDLKLKKSGLEWMYRDAKLNDEKEDYLLGKKKLDSSILNQPAATAAAAAADTSATSAALHKDSRKKNLKLLRDDPMSRFKITKQHRKPPNISKTTTPQRGKPLPKPASDLDY
ncbi:cwc25p [Saccharomyces arboricola H-6]|uniref:Pre-mRNA-splicing factor CWC25 n=1 Tax=Saccharomyces arboricola (strain H-6 / AS 2.3317 / CBS 10644) TaxID=1160507 RepID=J8LJ70_SACAR|nr:cwc25p [Saccharomyces arboricola H-6]